MAKQKNIAERQGKAIESILRLSKCKMGSNITRKKNKNWTKMGFAPTEKDDGESRKRGEGNLDLIWQKVEDSLT